MEVTEEAEAVAVAFMEEEAVAVAFMEEDMSVVEAFTLVDMSVVEAITEVSPALRLIAHPHSACRNRAFPTETSTVSIRPIP